MSTLHYGLWPPERWKPGVGCGFRALSMCRGIVNRSNKLWFCGRNRYHNVSNHSAHHPLTPKHPLQVDFFLSFSFCHGIRFCLSPYPPLPPHPPPVLSFPGVSFRGESGGVSGIVYITSRLFVIAALSFRCVCVCMGGGGGEERGRGGGGALQTEKLKVPSRYWNLSSRDPLLFFNLHTFVYQTVHTAYPTSCGGRFCSGHIYCT